LLSRPILPVVPQARPAAPAPHIGRAPPPEETSDADEPGRRVRQRQVRRFGYRAIFVVAALALAELVYLLVS
ncbi:MAG: hypothetical protein JRI68_15950, partial [Deltaproteobacteria bacterium]|nr:hypothetical protein [Deltaproteobacteria bacterium]